MDRCQNNRPARVKCNINLIAYLDPREIHERSIEDDPLRVSDFGNGLSHGVILCFTERQLSMEPQGRERHGRESREADIRDVFHHAALFSYVVAVAQWAMRTLPTGKGLQCNFPDLKAWPLCSLPPRRASVAA